MASADAGVKDDGEIQAAADALDTADTASGDLGEPALDAGQPTDATGTASDAVDPGDVLDVSDTAVDSAGPPDAAATDAGASDAEKGEDSGQEKDQQGGKPDAAGDGSTAWQAKLGFASQMDGKVAVFDLDTMEVYATVGDGHELVHGSGVSQNQQVLWYPNPDTQMLERYVRGPTPAIWTKTKAFAAPKPFVLVKASADGSVVASSNGQMSFANFGGSSDGASDYFAVFDTAAQSWLKPISIPYAAIFDISADGSLAYVVNRPSHKVVVVAPKAGKVVGEYDALPSPAGKFWFGPAEVAVSHDGKWLVATNLELESFSLFETDKMDKPTLVQTGKVLHSVCFSPDDERIFLQVLAAKPIPYDEMGNASIPSSLLVYDRKTLKPLADLAWKWSSAHVQAPPWGNSVYLSASFSAILRYDAKALQLTGEQILMPGMPMPIMSIRF